MSAGDVQGRDPVSQPPPPGFEGINVVQERPVEGAVPEPGGLPPAPAPKPPVKASCRTCQRTHVSRTKFDTCDGVVSPGGVEHIGTGGGDTACGKDATRDGWWWPL